MDDEPNFRMLPTIKIVHPESPDDFLVINESDFDPKQHVKWNASAVEEPPSTVSWGYTQGELEVLFNEYGWAKIKEIADSLPIKFTKTQANWEKSIPDLAKFIERLQK